MLFNYKLAVSLLGISAVIFPQGLTLAHQVFSPSLSVENQRIEIQIAQIISINQFSDVSSEDFYFSALQNLITQYGIIEGYPDGTFRGNNLLTRHEFIFQLNSALDTLVYFDIFLTQPSINAPRQVFDIRDISPTDYTFQVVTRLVELYGIDLLYCDQTFRGDQTIINQELYTYLNQAFGLNYPIPVDIKPVTRGEFMVILNRILTKVMETELAEH